jgi:reverse gyrase
MVDALKSIYLGLCPNCDGPVHDVELLSYGVCRNCLVLGVDGKPFGVKPGKYSGVLELRNKVDEFEDFFKTFVGARLWSLQRTWAKRIHMGRSFSIVAPTGTGKTTFCLVTALYNALRGWKSYILVPTSLLVQHLLDRAAQYLSRMNVNTVRAVGYYSTMPKNLAGETLNRVREGDFDILITTDKFLYTRFELLKGKKFKFIFVDDVDSFLRSPRNIDKVLMLMGFTESAVARLLAEAGGRESEENDMGFATSPESILVVAGATIRGTRTKRMRLFRKALGFEPGRRVDFVRNVANYYMKPEDDVTKQVVELVRRHGGGCLIFVPQPAGLKQAKTLEQALNEAGVPSHMYEKASPTLLEKFVAGKYEVLVGVATLRSPLARGLDLPQRIRYVVFAGVPRREIFVSWEEHRPSLLQSVIRHLTPILEEKYLERVSAVSGMLAKCIPTSSEVLEVVERGLRTGTEPPGYAGYVYRAVRSAHQLLREAVGLEEVRKIAESNDLRIKVGDGGFSIIIPDIDFYVQASGRASRLYGGGTTRGISIVIVDDEKAFKGLTRALESLYEEEFKEYSPELAAEDFRKCDEDRKRVRELLEGRLQYVESDLIRSALVVVESPTKARTLSYFFGSPAKRTVDGLTVYESVGEGYVACFTASQGHVVDLTTEAGFHGVLVEEEGFVPVYTEIRRCLKCGAQVTEGEVCPNCGGNKFYGKKDVITALRNLAIEFDQVFIATDPDSEGEKIGYDLFVNINPFNNNIKRLELHEITRRALREALKSPRDISHPLVEAQVVRRIDDRWVGFELSRRLWDYFGRKNLSAGRVQTPVLGWVVQRAEEAKKRRTVVTLKLDDGSEFDLIEPPNQNQLPNLLKDKALTVEIAVAARFEQEVLPPPPYTTDALLKDASLILRMDTSEAMEAAQTLFESGLITYHRTSSTYVSTTGINVAKTYLEENFPGLFRPRHHGEQGAHECTRPTKPLTRRQLELFIQGGMLRLPVKLEKRHLDLYELIFKRFMASQMAAAKVERTAYNIKLLGQEMKLERVTGVISPGFTILYPSLRAERPLPTGIHRVADYQIRKVRAAQPFREGELVGLMKERGIGRPSTYAHIINVLYKRGYIINSNGRILPTRLGRTVYNFLTTRYGHLVSEDLTRRLEELMDEVESGRLNYTEVLQSFYKEILSIDEKAPSSQ